MDWSIIWASRSLLLHGLAMSGLLVLTGAVGGMILGAGLALMRLSRYRLLAVPAAAYVTVMRTVPLILVLFWFYFMLPLFTGHPLGALSSALTSFVLFEAAFYCEIVRAGIQSVPTGQRLAGAATGLKDWQTLRLIILPQAIAAMVPLLLNQVIILFQDTSLVYVVALHDFLTAANIVADQQQRPIEMYTFVAIVYLVICYSLSLLVGRSKAPLIR
jgi:glutamate/aspartate transport system permease protein